MVHLVFFRGKQIRFTRLIHSDSKKHRFSSLCFLLPVIYGVIPFEGKVEIVLGTYKDPAYGLDWHEQTDEIESTIRDLLFESKLPIEFSRRESNIGRGADYSVTVVQVLSVLGFVIPKVHKRVRESLEEWGCPNKP